MITGSNIAEDKVMIDKSDDLSKVLVRGQIIKDMLAIRQFDFDKSNPYMIEDENRAADLLQRVMKSSFDEILEKEKKEHDFSGMDVIELRIWSPDIQCAMMKIYEHLVKDYGLFHHIALSSGLIHLCPHKLYYIAIIVRKMDPKDLFGEEIDEDGNEKLNEDSMG